MLHCQGNEQTSTKGNNMDESHQDNIEWELTHIWENILLDYIYIHFKDTKLISDNSDCLCIGGWKWVGKGINKEGFSTLSSISRDAWWGAQIHSVQG